jgi:hypothetical protein
LVSNTSRTSSNGCSAIGPVLAYRRVVDEHIDVLVGKKGPIARLEQIDPFHAKGEFVLLGERPQLGDLLRVLHRGQYVATQPRQAQSGAAAKAAAGASDANERQWRR